MWQPHVEAPCLWNRGLCKVPSGAVNVLKLFLVSLYRCPVKAAGFLELVLYFVKIPLWAILVELVVLKTLKLIKSEAKIFFDWLLIF